MKGSPPSPYRGLYRDDPEARGVYSEAAGIGRALPTAVAAPTDAADLQQLLVWAAERQRALIPRGSGSSMAGGAIGGDVIVDLSRWRSLQPVDREHETIRVAPGVLRSEVDRAARAYGLRFPVDPSSGAFCTIGGMVATNASGPHSLLAGSIRPWVNALTCVCVDGATTRVQRGIPSPGEGALGQGCRAAEAIANEFSANGAPAHDVCKESSGYGVSHYTRSRDVIDLLVGSEGTLALFTEIELRLERVPAASRSVLGSFPELSSAAAAAVGARSSGAAACELLDKTFLDVARATAAALGIPDRDEAVLLVEVEGSSDAEAAERAGEIERAFRTGGASLVKLALKPADAEQLWTLRHAASPTLSRLDPSLKSMQFIEDGAVPPHALPQYVRGIRDILTRHATRGVIFGHAGDAHVHVNPLVDVSDPRWRNRVDGIFDEAVALTATLGGTLSGEHGDGRLRTPVLDRVWAPEALAAFRRIKEAFDPSGLLNPGVKVGARGQQPIERVKYDPSLPSLPLRAAAALAVVERDRAYARSRLELLNER